MNAKKGSHIRGDCIMTQDDIFLRYVRGSRLNWRYIGDIKNRTAL